MNTSFFFVKSPRLARGVIPRKYGLRLHDISFGFDVEERRLEALSCLEKWLYVAGLDRRMTATKNVFIEISQWAHGVDGTDENAELNLYFDVDTRPATCWFDVINIRYCSKSARSLFVIEGRFS